MYLSIVGDSCSIMSNDYELTMVLVKVDLKLIDLIVLIVGTCG